MNEFYLSGEEENIEAAIESVGDNSLVIMGYGVVKNIDLVKELNGESNVLRAVAYSSWGYTPSFTERTTFPRRFWTEAEYWAFPI